MKVKKFLTVISVSLIFIFGTVSTIQAKEYFLTLADSGTTTVPSGVSEMEVNSGVTYVKGLENFKGATCILQLTSISGLTVPRGASNNWNTIDSGVTFTVRYKESIVRSLLPYAQTTDIISGMALSGNTPYQVRFYPEAMGYIAFEFVSGISQWETADFIFKVISDN